MKQKLLDKILYVFSVEPYEITEDADKADVIKVQLECLDGYIKLNPDLESKLTPYNYHLFTVTRQEWADYVDEPDPVSPELAWSANTATVTINADDNVYPTLTNPNSVTVTYTSSDTEKATINASSGAITLVAAGNTTISAVFEGNDTYEAQTVTYTLTINAEPVPETYHVYLNPTSDATQETLTVVIDDVTVNEWSYDESADAYVFDVTEGSVFAMYPTGDPVDWSLTSETELDWVDDHWEITPTEDINITIDYVIPASEYTVTLMGTGASDTYINVEVGGGLITDFTDYIDQETGNVLFTVNDGDEIKIYPLDNQENYSVICADADVNVDDSDQYYWYVAIPTDTTIEVDYTESAPE